MYNAMSSLTPSSNKGYNNSQLPPPRFPDYQTYQQRLDSYNDPSHPWPSACPAQPGDLADAGLFYTKTGDKVQCAFCAGKLYNWGPSDAPLTEHSKHFPNCSFIKDFKVSRSREALSSVPRGIDLPAAKVLIQEGFSLNEVQKAVGELLKMKFSLLDIQSEVLRDVIHQNRQQLHQSLGATPTQSHERIGATTSPQYGGVATAYPQAYIEAASKSQAGGVGLIINTVAADSTDSGSHEPEHLQHKLEQVKNENRLLKFKQMCQGCESADATILYLPCRHMVSCEDCARQATFCIDCKSPVYGSVKTYVM